MEVGNYPQSVGLEAYNLKERVWGRIVNELAKRVDNPKAILILGLGGGTVAHLFAKQFPEVLIDSVEIDPVVVNVGKNFFGLDKIPNLKIIVADAFEAIENPENFGFRFPHYEAIVVDTYLRDESPRALEDRKILKQIKELLVHGGIAVFNRISRLSPQDFRLKLSGVFDSVEEVGVSYGWGLPPGNILFFCS